MRKYTLTKETIFNTKYTNNKEKKSSKFFYKQLTKEKCEIVKLNFWSDEIDISEISLLDISQIMMSKVVQIKENKVKEFNYKLIFRKGACGKLVNNWDKNVSDICSVCQNPETQIHIIFRELVV